jgi:hypothetical protein
VYLVTSNKFACDINNSFVANCSTDRKNYRNSKPGMIAEFSVSDTCFLSPPLMKTDGCLVAVMLCFPMLVMKLPS